MTKRKKTPSEDFRLACAEADAWLAKHPGRAMTPAIKKDLRRRTPPTFTDGELRGIKEMISNASIPGSVYPEIISVMAKLRRYFGEDKR